MQGPFKKYAREPRAQVTEEIFGSGMAYTNAPQKDKFLKELVNYDLKDMGEVIKPRPALVSYAVGQNTLEALPYSSALTLSAGKHCVETDTTQCSQLILGEVSSEKVPDTNLFYGKAIVATLGDTEEPNVEGLPSRRMVYSGKDDGNKYVFKKPTKAEIHGMILEDTAPIATQVGTFAFGNGYYSFATKDNVPKLMQTKYDDEAKRYNSKEIDVRELTPKEAVMWGYNMLAEDPYKFACTNTSGSIVLTGLLPYDKDNNLIMTPLVNQTLKLKCYYAAPQDKTYSIRWEYKEVTASEWNQIKDRYNHSTNDLKPIECEFSSPVAQVMIRVTIEQENKVDDKVLYDTLQVLAVGFNFTKEDYGSTANVEPKNYDLSKATGMCYWKNRLVAYGITSDPTLLFMSEVNDPSYFPFPSCSDIFEEPIVYAVPLQDNLLVFTVSQLYMIKLNPDGLSWTKKLIQSNLTIQEWDLHLIRVVKNMVFFKSGNYYYMVVPKLNSNGELTIAPVSKPIEPLLDKFKQNVEKTLEILYNYKEDITLVHYYNYLDYEDVHNVYVFKTSKGVYLNYILLYNSMDRHWRTYIIESKSIIKPYKQDATKRGTLMSLCNVNGNVGVQFMQYTQETQTDYYVNATDIYFKNYQLLDTGYRNHSVDYKKRYRELQFNINNTSQQQLKFYTEFTVDGELRKALSKYNVVHNVDPNSKDYGVISLEREFIDPSIVPSTTVLAPTSADTDYWLLDNSRFPETMSWKVRIPVSGKGYAPRLLIVCMSPYSYELLNLAWVFRALYSR